MCICHKTLNLVQGIIGLLKVCGKSPRTGVLKKMCMFHFIFTAATSVKSTQRSENSMQQNKLNRQEAN